MQCNLDVEGLKEKKNQKRIHLILAENNFFIFRWLHFFFGVEDEHAKGMCSDIEWKKRRKRSWIHSTEAVMQFTLEYSGRIIKLLQYCTCI